MDVLLKHYDAPSMEEESIRWRDTRSEVPTRASRIDDAFDSVSARLGNTDCQ